MRILSHLRAHLFNNNINSAYKLALKDPKKYSAFATSIINKKNEIADEKIIKMQKKNREIESITEHISSIERYIHGNNINRIEMTEKYIYENNKKIDRINFIMGKKKLQSSNLTTTPPCPDNINTTLLPCTQNHATVYLGKYYWRSQY
ncbi:hypothetical protein LOZ86_03690 [Pectobacterium parvum]|uniref:Uncharacterized protein n=1 Tax=Pectobacterium parvum TaxID=2778550 RepID=A0AAP9LCJ5_9GAMM|nr:MULTISPECIES: hypothetical protein [Pectobacterium]GKW43680.1 hypothetical protein PEC301879_35380 [Pectobacterium carotovorum subsp. carotovorum]KFX10653.1 hypothetical protein KP17_17750 [Pectobacterium parvum]MCU1803501.1 hypothetical protein [Pectobacterium parvum]QHQ24357.1 hypothetical protein GMX10_09960 [Pectobacterium parvum]UFK39995.1 hypothetical protein LOZ86_03690 [Pectobacterium parvum]